MLHGGDREPRTLTCDCEKKDQAMNENIVFRVWRDSARQFTSGRTKKDFTSEPEAVAFANKHSHQKPSVERITTEQVTGWEDRDQ